MPGEDSRAVEDGIFSLPEELLISEGKSGFHSLPRHTRSQYYDAVHVPCSSDVGAMYVHRTAVPGNTAVRRHELSRLGGLIPVSYAFP